MKIQIPKKIRIEDFQSDDQELAAKIGEVFNDFANEVYQVLDGGIDISNMNRELIDVDIMVNANNALVNPPKLKTTVAGRIRGVNVINAINLVNPNTYPSSHPFVSFSANGNLITIQNVTGLQANSKYRLTLEIIV